LAQPDATTNGKAADTTPPAFDPGLSQKFVGDLRRAINKDGSFNVRRPGLNFQNLHIYQWLISISWPSFLALLLGGYFVMNSVFACLYLLIGIDSLQGADMTSPLQSFLSAFFFSAHTFTTVGYGTLAPLGFTTNLLAAFEAMAGLMSFALATGLLYGRFSRPSVRLIFSDHALIAPYQNKTSLQFRVANQRSNMLMELEASVMLMTVEHSGEQLVRRYSRLPLERESIYFLPITWTIVHPIDLDSPFFGITHDVLAARQAEILIMLKGFDETFGQIVHTRYSYRFDEIIWGARFRPAFQIDEEGDMVLDLERISDTELAPL
jgi:inward rectifier potassium channel